MCNVTITGVRGIESTVGNGPDQLEVRGTADQCDSPLGPPGSVCVHIVQTDPVDMVTPEKTAVVTAAGSWTVTFRIQDGDFAPGDFLCGIGNKAVVMAHCCDDATCDTQMDLDTLQCGECPAISQVGAAVAANCNDDGTRSVTIAFIVTPGATGSVVVQVLNDDGLGPSAEVVSAPNTTVSKVLDYEPGAHSATVEVIAPAGCNGATVTFLVPPCDVPAPCPEIEFITAQRACDARGRRQLDVEARVVLASGETVTAILVQVDNAGVQIGAPLDSGSDPTGTLVLTASRLFQAGTTARFRVVVTEPEDCPGTIQTVAVPDCAEQPEPPDEPVDDDLPPDDGDSDGCPWWWLLPVGLVLLIGGVAMTVVGSCLLNTPLLIAGGLAGAAAIIPLMFWAVLCRDCDTMKAVLLTGVGAFDVLAVLALILSATGQAACAAGFLGGALMVATTTFGLAAPYMVLCMNGCTPLRVVFGTLSGVYAALLLAALVAIVAGQVAVAVTLITIAAIVAAVAFNLVLLPMLLLCV